MTVRFTLLLDDDLATRLRDLQARFIKKTGKHKSLSRIANEVIRIGLKHIK